MRAQAADLKIERVVGLTAERVGALAAHPTSGELAYTAGCVVVVLDPVTGNQTQFLRRHNAPGVTPKPLTCVAYASPKGRHLAAGEVCALQM